MTSGDGAPRDAGELAAVELPPGVELVRSTDRFDAESVPKGLLSAHRVAPAVWGELRVFAGEVDFVLESTGATRRLGVGERQVIEPDTLHHVALGEDAEFEVSFHRTPDGP